MVFVKKNERNQCVRSRRGASNYACLAGGDEKKAEWRRRGRLCPISRHGRKGEVLLDNNGGKGRSDYKEDLWAASIEYEGKNHH